MQRSGLRLLMIFVAFVFLFAAGSKAWNPHPLAATLAHLSPWVQAPAEAMPYALAVVVVETFIGGALLLGWTPRWLLGATIILLASFTAVLITLWRDPLSPGCGCFGWNLAARRINDEAPLGIVRNGALIGVIGVLMTTDAAAKRNRRNPTHRIGLRSGFTLIETLLIVAILALVLALVLPTVSRFREGTRDSRSLSHLRQLHMAATLYGEHHREAFPYFATPGDPWAPIRLNGRIYDPPNYFRTLSFNWPTLIRDYHDDPRSLLRPDLASEYDPDTGIIATRFWLTHTAFARPEYWNDDNTPDDLRLYASTRWSDIAFPSQKGLFLDSWGGSFSPARRSGGRTDGALGHEALVGFGDGSSSVRVWTENDAQAVVTRPFASVTWPVMATRRGLAGVDLQEPR